MSRPGARPVVMLRSRRWLHPMVLRAWSDAHRQAAANVQRPVASVRNAAGRFSQRIEERAQSDDPGGAADVEKQTWMKETVGALLERASPDDRTILVLKEMEEFTVEEIAQIMKLTETAVKVRLHRARKRMLEDYARWRKGR